MCIRDRPIAVIPGSQLLSVILPQYVRDDPRLVHAFDEAAADELCAKLNTMTIGQLIDAKRLKVTELPSVLPEDTLLEIASIMDRGHYPIIVVRDKAGRYRGVLTMSRAVSYTHLDVYKRQVLGVRRPHPADLSDIARGFGRSGPGLAARWHTV